ncbi:hypothetical protein GEMRC1_001532 [Eukaryota sp. GEM-RC1]
MPIDVRLTAQLVTLLQEFIDRNDELDKSREFYDSETEGLATSDLDFDPIDDPGDLIIPTHRRSRVESDLGSLSDENSGNSQDRSSFMTFHHVRVAPLQLSVSYKGSKTRNIQDFSNLRILLPQLTYSNKTLSWTELGDLIRHEVITRVLPQTAAGFLSEKITNVFRKNTAERQEKSRWKRKKYVHPLSGAIEQVEEKKQLFSGIFRTK